MADKEKAPKTKKHVVVIGGGYAGVMAANRLATQVPVTLVTAAPRFVERIRLHEVVAGVRADAEVEYTSLLHPTVRLRVGRVVHLGERMLRLADGETLAFDHAVYAVGSAAAGGITSADGAARIRSQLDALPAGAGVAVLGGGLTGIETAAEIAQARPHLRVELRTSGVVAPHESARGRASALASLRRLGVDVVENVGTPASADVVIRCTGFAVPALAADSGLPVDADGRIRVDPSLRVLGSDTLYAAGDAAVIDDPGYDYLRMSCAAALPMGARAADSILATLRGEVPRPHDAGFLARCVSIGRRDALLQFVGRDDHAGRVVLNGRAAALMKETICRYTLRWLRTEAKRPGAYAAPKGPARTKELVA
ncbi:FAD-dependent oxidoreductase [Microbacteriaceae bacterium VKM Ac-2854]|nr:FAD-dependent oxidoreductase [Microbacteriaceae bacterium VKM Ac-2854]